ncbi:MAG: phosphoribosylanthranilate isomerase, partial [Kiritimatiellae bacterium]|nr:phosphoribosylanthranilate isomerase [Kiritimatiellia bacterium]
MPRIKVCGVTDAAFAVEAARRGVDYLGLIFAEGSPRQVTPEKAHEIVAHVRADVGTSAVKSTPRFVGVFVRHTPAEIVDVATRVGLDAIQLHGDYGDSAVTTLKKRGYEVWRLFNAVGRTAEADGVEGQDSPRGRLRCKPQRNEIAHRLLAGLDLQQGESLED